MGLSEKLNRVNAEKNEVSIKIEYKGKSLYETKLDIPEYADNIVNENESEFFYFFKDIAAKFEEKINEIQKNQYLSGENK